MRMVLLGAPGSGKGTIAEELASHYGIPHISSGDIFRYNIQHKTPLGNEAESYITAGNLVPDDITIRMIHARLSEKDCEDGFVLDGYPRTIQQAEELESQLAKNGLKLNVVLNVVLSKESILKRISGRRVCTQCGNSYNVKFLPPAVKGICDKCGGKLIHRPDDVPETVAKRLETYHIQTEPLTGYYKSKGLLKEFDNELSSAESIANIKDHIMELE